MSLMPTHALCTCTPQKADYEPQKKTRNNRSRQVAYPVAHVLVGVAELGNERGVLCQLPLSHPDPVLEPHQLCLQICHSASLLLLLQLSCCKTAHRPQLCQWLHTRGTAGAYLPLWDQPWTLPHPSISTPPPPPPRFLYWVLIWRRTLAAPTLHMQCQHRSIMLLLGLQMGSQTEGWTNRPQAS